MVFFDFDGVLCSDLFYTNLENSYPKIREFINNEIFSKNSDLADRWMRAELSSDDINKFICDHNHIDFNTLSQLFIESVKSMRVDKKLLKFAENIKTNCGKVAIVTNNMDVFNQITIANHSLDKIFPVIINSCDYGMLKADNDGKLFDIALEKLGVADYKDVLLIDDSKSAREVFESKGGKTYAYENYDKFEQWFNENYF